MIDRETFRRLNTWENFLAWKRSPQGNHRLEGWWEELLRRMQQHG